MTETAYAVAHFRDGLTSHTEFPSKGAAEEARSTTFGGQVAHVMRRLPGGKWEPVETYCTELLPWDAPRELWLQARKQGVGASDCSAIMRMSRYGSPRQVWAEKTGRSEEEPPNWPMIHGRHLEHGLREWYSQTTGAIVDRSGILRSTREPFMLYSPDGLIGDEGTFEGKYATFRMREAWSEEQVSDHAEIQVQAGLFVTGRKWSDVTVAVSDDEPVVRRVYADLELQHTIVETCRQFWYGNVLEDIEPLAMWIDIDDLRDTYAQSNPATVHHGGPTEDALCRQKRKASEMAKEWTAAEGDAKAQLMVAMGKADHLVIAGEIAATWKTNTAGVRSLLIPKTRKQFKEWN